MATRSTIVYPNPELLAQAVAARTLLTIGDLLAEAGRMRVDIAVTGGTDGNRVFAELKASPLSATVDWWRVHIWWGDERFVAADDDDRNAKQARRALFDGMIADGTLPAENIHEMPADSRSADRIASDSPERTDEVLAEAAAAYQRELVAALGDTPTLDIAMFGMGPDAHFASLFPGLPQVLIDDPHVLVASVRDSPKPPPLRLTLTVPMIARSRHTWVFTSEARKARAVAKTFAAPRNPQAPSSFADGGELLWLIDEGAAGELPGMRR